MDDATNGRLWKELVAWWCAVIGIGGGEAAERDFNAWPAALFIGVEFGKEFQQVGVHRHFATVGRRMDTPPEVLRYSDCELRKRSLWTIAGHDPAGDIGSVLAMPAVPAYPPVGV